MPLWPATLSAAPCIEQGAVKEKMEVKEDSKVKKGVDGERRKIDARCENEVKK